MEICVRRKAEQAAQHDVRETRCPHCERGWAVRLEEEAPRYAVTVRGRIDYVRPVYRCDQADCRRERCLFDEELGLDAKEHYTPLMQDKLAWAGTSGSSFERASRDLAHQNEIEVSAAQIRRVTEQAGQRALALQDEEVKQRGAPASLEAPIPTAEQPETVVIEMDGTCAIGRAGRDGLAGQGAAGVVAPLLLCHELRHPAVRSDGVGAGLLVGRAVGQARGRHRRRHRLDLELLARPPALYLARRAGGQAGGDCGFLSCRRESGQSARRDLCR
jgi:hypothetical protein